MRVLVYPHAMEIGGSQLNALELAGAVRDRGHDVIVASRKGPLVAKVADLGLEHVAVPEDCGQLSPKSLRFLTQLVASHRIDVVHGYEWPPAIALYFGPHLMRRVPVVATVMSMAVAPFLPRKMPLLVGTQDIRQRAIDAGHTAVTLLEPPVDTIANSPTFDGSQFRSQFGLDPDRRLIVVVGRLSNELKLEGLLSACDTVGIAASRGVAIQLAIVGDGAARQAVEMRAAAANAKAGRRVVALTGAMDDPRPAYAAADILLGMGSSALRGMAFAKPLVVQGERGFWQLCTPQSAGRFLESGWYGIGETQSPLSDPSLERSARHLLNELAPLIDDAGLRNELGDFGRKLVVDRFSLAQASVLQESIYSSALADTFRPMLGEALLSAAGVVSHKLVRKLQHARGLSTSEDFNAVALLNSQTTEARQS